MLRQRWDVLATTAAMMSVDNRNVLFVNTVLPTSTPRDQTVNNDQPLTFGIRPHTRIHYDSNKENRYHFEYFTTTLSARDRGQSGVAQ